MTYNSILDSFFTYWYINLGALALFILLSLLIRKKYIYTYKGKIFFRIFFAGIILIWVFTFFLLNPMFLGYGHPVGVEGLVSADGKLYVVDYILTGGSRAAGPAEYSRVNILDAETGSKILRFPVGEYSNLYGVKGDSLIFYGDNLIKIFSASSGNLIAKWNRKTLPDVFPELSSGIDHIMISYAYKLLEITTLDANHYNLSLQTGELWSGNRFKPKSDFTPVNKIYLQNDNEIKILDQHGGKTILQLQGTGGNQEVRYLKNRNGSVVNEMKFIMGEFIAVSEAKKCFVVLSFETTKKIGCTLTGISLDGQNKLWELNQSTLRPDDERNYPLSTCWTLDNNSDVLFFAIKDEVIALHIETGNIFWREKL